MRFANKATPTGFIDSKHHANKLKNFFTGSFHVSSYNSLPGVDMHTRVHTHTQWMKEISWFRQIKMTPTLFLNKSPNI